MHNRSISQLVGNGLRFWLQRNQIDNLYCIYVYKLKILRGSNTRGKSLTDCLDVTQTYLINSQQTTHSKFQKINIPRMMKRTSMIPYVQELGGCNYLLRDHKYILNYHYLQLQALAHQLKTLQRKSQSHHHRHHCQKNSNHHEFPACGNFDVNETNDHILFVRFKCSNLN